MTEDLTPITLSAGLSKRLAEAADSFRDGKYHFFLSKLSYPYDLKYTDGYTEPDDASAAADDLLAQLGSDYKKFGPFNTPSDDEPAIDYDSIQLVLKSGEEEVYTTTLSKTTDAIILSLSAYDKFFHTYYTRLYGDEAAAEFRSAAQDSLTSSTRKPPPTHHDGTIYTSGFFQQG